MNEKAKFYARVYGNCPYCERPFRRKKSCLDPKLVRKLVTNILDNNH